MLQLIKLEMRKLISGYSPKIVMIIMCLFIGISAIIGINSEMHSKRISASYGDSESGLRGINAIKEKKVDLKMIEGYMDGNKIKDALKYSKAKMKLIKNQEKIKPEDWMDYSRIESKIIITFSELNQFNYSVIEELDGENATGLYDERVNRIEGYLNLEYDNPHFDQRDKGLIINKAKEMERPLYLVYADGWKNIIEGFYAINIVIILGICFMVIRIFTEDISNEMALIVKSTVNGKRALVISKIIACSIFTILTYIIFNLMYSGINLLAYGMDGFSGKIQIYTEYWLSIYNINFIQAYLIALIAGTTISIFMVMLTLMVSNIVKKDYATIGVTVFVFMIPLMINTSKVGKTLNNIVELLPIRALNISYSLRQQCFYNIFGNDLLRLYVVPIVMIIGSIILAPLVVFFYRKQRI